MIGYPHPPLASEKVVLRRWDRDDLPLVREASAEPALVRGTTLPVPFTDDGGLAFIQRQWSRAEVGEGISLVIDERGPATASGCVTLMLRRAAVADLGYWLVRDARGRGLGLEAVSLIVEWALEEMTIEGIEAFVDPENEPSRRILGATGFSLIGSRRHAVGRIDEELLVYRRGR